MVLTVLYVEKGRAGKWIFSKCPVGALVTPLRFPSALFNKITVAAFLPWRGSFHRKACKDRASTLPALSVQKHQNLSLSFDSNVKQVFGYKPLLPAQSSPTYSCFKPFIRLFWLLLGMEQYDVIGKNYSDMIKIDPIKLFVQRPSTLSLLGEVDQKRVLDIGCGDGIISRMVAKQGAKVIAFDPSTKQIEVAIEEEKKNPLGIKYFVSSIQKFSSPAVFDSAFAVMVLCYAQNTSELQSFFDLTFLLLKKGGQFVIIDFDKSALPLNTSYYGRHFTKLPNGNICIEWNIPGVPKYSTEVTYFSKKEFEECAKKAGFTKITSSPLVPNKEGVLKMGKDYWEEFINHPIWFGMKFEK